MASEKRKQPRGSDTQYRDSDDERSSDARKLPDRAPQFGELAKTAAGQCLELSPSQKKFLDDFAERLTEGAAEGDDASAAEGDDASAAEADVDGRGKESRRI